MQNRDELKPNIEVILSKTGYSNTTSTEKSQRGLEHYRTELTLIYGIRKKMLGRERS